MLFEYFRIRNIGQIPWTQSSAAVVTQIDDKPLVERSRKEFTKIGITDDSALNPTEAVNNSHEGFALSYETTHE